MPPPFKRGGDQSSRADAPDRCSLIPLARCRRSTFLLCCFFAQQHPMNPRDQCTRARRQVPSIPSCFSYDLLLLSPGCASNAALITIAPVPIFYCMVVVLIFLCFVFQYTHRPLSYQHVMCVSISGSVAHRGPGSIEEGVCFAPGHRHVQALQRPQEPSHVQQHPGVSHRATQA